MFSTNINKTFKYLLLILVSSVVAALVFVGIAMALEDNEESNDQIILNFYSYIINDQEAPEPSYDPQTHEPINPLVFTNGSIPMFTGNHIVSSSQKKEWPNGPNTVKPDRDQTYTGSFSASGMYGEAWAVDYIEVTENSDWSGLTRYYPDTFTGSGVSNFGSISIPSTAVQDSVDVYVAVHIVPKININAKVTTRDGARELDDGLQFTWTHDKLEKYLDSAWPWGHIKEGEGTGYFPMDKQTTTHEPNDFSVYIKCDHGYFFRSLKLNGVEQIPKSQVASTDTIFIENFTFPENQTYSIEAEIWDAYTITWSYDESSEIYGPEAYVANGKVEVTGIEGETLKDDPHSHQDAEGGYFLLYPEAVVSLKLMPDYGYEASWVTSPTGASLIPQTEPNAYKLDQLGTQNLMFKDIFVATENSINVNAEDVKEASVENLSAAAEYGGSVIVNIEDNLEYQSEAMDEFIENLDAEQFSNPLDITVTNRVAKGDGTYWEVPLSQTAGPLTFTLRFKSALDNKKFYALRDHNEAIKDVTVSYTVADKLITFNSDLYSTFVFAKSLETPIPPQPEPEPVNPTSQTGDSMPMTVLMLLAAVSLASFLYIKRDRFIKAK